MDDDPDTTNAAALVRGMPFPPLPPLLCAICGRTGTDGGGFYPHPLEDACVPDWYCAAHRAEDDA
jgi:hypothetical protein